MPNSKLLAVGCVVVDDAKVHSDGKCIVFVPMRDTNKSQPKQVNNRLGPFVFTTFIVAGNGIACASCGFSLWRWRCSFNLTMNNSIWLYRCQEIYYRLIVYRLVVFCLPTHSVQPTRHVLGARQCNTLNDDIDFTNPLVDDGWTRSDG